MNILKEKLLLFFFCMSAGLWYQGFSTPLLNSVSDFHLESIQTQKMILNNSFSSEKVQQGVYIPCKITSNVYGVGLDAAIVLHNNAGLVRVVLIDELDNEYLLYETYALLTNDYSFTVHNAAIETKLLEGIKPKSLYVHTCNAKITIKDITYTQQPPVDRAEIAQKMAEIRNNQHALMIDLLNIQIKKKNMYWTAGLTPVSLKSYQEKKDVFKTHNGMLGNLQGYEYYSGGIFTLSNGELKDNIKTRAQSTVVDSFDWRNRHGATNPQSPYYDGDTTGSGWATSMKNQDKCASCWTFSTCSTIEMLLNLYYNKHLDYDLSEQYFLSCSCDEVCEVKGKPCSGGWSTDLTVWFTKHGVIEEKAFPYKIVDSVINATQCGDSSTSIPSDHLFFKQYITLRNLDKNNKIKITPDEDSLKRFLIHYGPLNVEIHSMWHCMHLIGFTKNNATGKTVWIFKNSVGVKDVTNNSGVTKKGISYFEIALDDFRSVDAIRPPVCSNKLTDNDIQCSDKDKDGYYNWGIGPKPATCPSLIKSEEDCDDSDSLRGPMDSTGLCKKIDPTSIDMLSGEKNSHISFGYINNFKNKQIIFNLLMNREYCATITIYSVIGIKIKSINVTPFSSTMNTIMWDMKSQHGNSVSSGVYLCRVDVQGSHFWYSNACRLLVVQ